MGRRPDHGPGARSAARRWLGAAGLAAGLAALGGEVAAGPSIPTLDVSGLRPGMKGYAKTVFFGTRPERFDIEVIDVVRNYLPKQDAVLFRSNDPRLLHTGIVGGMSGSPIFIDGKLIGALAYGYRFNKDPIGGLTPIDNMLAVSRLPHRPEVLPTARARAARARRGSTRALQDALLGLDTSPLPPRRRPTVADAVGLVALPIPTTISGLGPAAAYLAADRLGVLPVRAGSAAGTAPNARRPFEPGDSVSVVLIDGENAIAPNGTVTWTDPTGTRILAFGHPMFGDGPTQIPFADARVHTIIPSVERSVKIASPGTIRGAMIQDRQAAIYLRSDVAAETIPITTRVDPAEAAMPDRIYENRLAVGRNLTHNLVAILLAEAAQEALRDATEVVLEVEHVYAVTTRRGPRTVTIREQEFFPSGVIPNMLAASRGVVTAAVLLDNDFEVAEIRRIDQRVRLSYGASFETIEDVRVDRTEVRAGEALDLRVQLRDYHGGRRVQVLPVRIPGSAAGETIQIRVTGGQFVRPYRPIPRNLDDLLDTLESFYDARTLVVSVYRPDEGLAARGELLPGLPDSVLETLEGHGTTQPLLRFKRVARRVTRAPSIIEGRHTIKVRVRPARTAAP